MLLTVLFLLEHSRFHCTGIIMRLGSARIIRNKMEKKLVKSLRDVKDQAREHINAILNCAEDNAILALQLD